MLPGAAEIVHAEVRLGGFATWVTSVAELEADMREFIDLNQMRMEF